MMSKLIKNCIICNKEFQTWTSTVKKGSGKCCSVKCGNILRKTTMRGNHNGMWKGNDVGVVAVHDWVRRRKLKPKLCEHCKKKPPCDLANISQKYKRDINDFKWLCRRCHMKSDGRIKNLDQSKLSKFQVQRIRLIKEIDPTITCNKIAKMFNMSHQHISDILRKKYWKNI
jgi:hypothetical protein